MTDFSARLDKIRSECRDMEKKLSSGALSAEEIKEISRKYSSCREIINLFEKLCSIENEMKQVAKILAEGEPQMAELAKSEIDILRSRKEKIENEIELLLIPPSPEDERNVFLEIRAGVGGEESALFAAELLRAYTKFAQRMSWKIEIRDINSTGLKGIKTVVAYVKGKKVYSWLKYEAGVHRVQRVPKTESSGRVHTSTVTVAVIPEMDALDVKIDEKDLKIDTYRAQGAGGQNVNKVETAVRITHVPTQVVAQCQQERSQAQNKQKALHLLYSKLALMAKEKQERAVSAERKKQVGSGERSEKIRTYNFPQNRVTDHRAQISWHNIDAIMEGEIEGILSKLRVVLSGQ